MSTTIADAASYCNASDTDENLIRSYNTATTLVTDYVRGKSVPETVFDTAVLTVTSELFSRRNSPGGLMQWGADGEVVRMSKDALNSVRPMLKPYLGIGAVG